MSRGPSYPAVIDPSLFFTPGSATLEVTDAGVIVATLVAIGVGIAVVYGWWIARVVRNKPLTGAEGIVGRTGVVVSDLRPEGEIVVDGIIWRARLVGYFDSSKESAGASRGDSVRVRGVDALSLLVERVETKKL